MKNPVINQIIKPYLIGASMFATVAAGGAAATIYNASTQTENPTETTNNTVKNIFVYTTSSLLVMLSTLVVIIYLKALPDSVQNKAKMLTERYIRDSMDLHPELKEFRSVLHNKKTLQNLTSVICNELNKQEQEKIVQIVKNFSNKFYGAEFEAHRLDITRELDRSVLEIVKNHADKNPHFIGLIQNMMKNSYETLYFSDAKQIVRS